MASLKTEYFIPYAAFLVGNLLAFGVLIASPYFFDELTSNAPAITQRVAQLLVPGAVAFVVALALNAFLPTSLKHALIFWKGREGLPGHRAFTQLAPNDPRIDLARLQQNCGGQFPTKPAEQNALWYRLLHKHEAHPAVADAHRRFLALRDMAASAVLLAVLLSIAAGVVKADPLLYPVLLGLLGIEYFILRVGAVNEAERLVCNVLAREAA